MDIQSEFPVLGIPDGTLQCVSVDGIGKILKRANGLWIDIVTNLPPPKESKVQYVSLGYSDRFGET